MIIRGQHRNLTDNLTQKFTNIQTKNLTITPNKNIIETQIKK